MSELTAKLAERLGLEEADLEVHDLLVQERVHLIARERRVSRKLWRFLAAALAAMWDRLQRVEAAMALEEVEAIMAGIKMGNAMVARQIAQTLAEELAGLYEEEYARVRGILQKTLEEDEQLRLGVARAEYATLPVHGVLPEEAVRNILARVEDRVERQVLDAWSAELQRVIDAGLGVRETVQRPVELAVATAAALAALRKKALEEVELMVQAELSAVFDRVVRQVSLENRHLYVGLLHSAVLDERTCDTCRELHGKIFYYVGEPNVADAPELPIHPNCRCIRVPVRLGEEPEVTAFYEALRPGERR